MEFTAEQLAALPSPYYRVATRAIVLDEQDRILVMENQWGEYELPGGGWEYEEDFETCLHRELKEELGVGLAQLSRFIGIYRGRGGRRKMYLRIAYRAILDSYDFHPNEGNRAWFATRDEFLALDFSLSGEEGVKQLADIIWANGENTV